MSLFGKILALLNLFGAVALAYFAIVDYNKRQAWQRSVLRHEFVLRGIPLDNEERDRQHRLLVNVLDDEMRNELFSAAQATPAVATQVAEVTNLRKEMFDRIEAAGAQEKDKAGTLARQTYQMARILLPLAGNLTDRDQVQAALANLRDAASEKLFRDRLRRAYDEAQKLYPDAVKIYQGARNGAAGVAARMTDSMPPTLAESFHLSLRAQGGDPATSFANEMARILPPTPAGLKNNPFDQLYERTLQWQANRFRALLTGYFDAAMGQASAPAPEGGAQDVADGQTPKTAADLQKAAVGRVLLAMAMVRADEAASQPDNADAAVVKGMPVGSAAYYARLPETAAYQKAVQRLIVVCGLRHGVNALSDRTAALVPMAGEVAADTVRERTQFVLDISAWLGLARQLARHLDEEERQLRDVKDLASTQSILSKQSAADAEKALENLRASQLKTRDAFERLKSRSEALLARRQVIQEIIRETEEGENHIRYLEKLIRDSEPSSTRGRAGSNNGKAGNGNGKAANNKKK